MNTELERQCPYAPYTSVLTVIRHMRRRDLKEPVTSPLITTIGVAEGNASRTIQALRFLDLLDEEGYITENFKAIGNAPSDEYPRLLEQTLRESYEHVFMSLDPATATDKQYENAFRYYQPKAQQSRMIMLFKGLCREAELIAGGAPETPTRPRTTSPKPLAPSQAGKRGVPKDIHSQPEPYREQTSTAFPIVVPTVASETPEFAILQGLLNQLPFVKKRWTQPHREKWIQAMTSAVDLLFEVSDIEDDTYNEARHNEYSQNY